MLDYLWSLPWQKCDVPGFRFCEKCPYLGRGEEKNKILGAICRRNAKYSPFLLSPRTPPFRVPNNSQDFSASDILLIPRQANDESFEASPAASSRAETTNYFSLNIVSCTSADSSAPLSPIQAYSASDGDFGVIEFSRRSPAQEAYDDLSVENLLNRIRQGSCNKSSLDYLLRLVGETKSGSVKALEEQVSSALIALLTSSQLDDSFKHTEAYEEAFAAIVRLTRNEVVLTWSATPEMLIVLDWILNRGTLDARVNAAILLQKICCDAGVEGSLVDRQSLLDGVVRLMLKKEQPNAVKLASRALLAQCLSVENRPRAVRAGAVAAIIKILPGASVTTTEKALAILELLATSPEGRDAMSEHELVVPVLVQMILKVSDRATEYAAGALCAICTPDTPQIQERVARAGAQTRLLLLLQSRCTSRAKRKALQLLKVLHRYWDQEPRIADCDQTERFYY